MKVFIVVYYKLPHWNMLQHMASWGYRPNFRHTPICFHFSWNNGARVDQPWKQKLETMTMRWDTPSAVELLQTIWKDCVCTYCMNRSKSDLRNYEVTWGHYQRTFQPSHVNRGNVRNTAMGEESWNPAVFTSKFLRSAHIHSPYAAEYAVEHVSPIFLKFPTVLSCYYHVLSFFGVAAKQFPSQKICSGHSMHPKWRHKSSSSWLGCPMQSDAKSGFNNIGRN